jgi:hypothetical protein
MHGEDQLGEQALPRAALPGGDGDQLVGRGAGQTQQRGEHRAPEVRLTVLVAPHELRHDRAQERSRGRDLLGGRAAGDRVDGHSRLQQVAGLLVVARVLEEATVGARDRGVGDAAERPDVGQLVGGLQHPLAVLLREVRRVGLLLPHVVLLDVVAVADAGREPQRGQGCDGGRAVVVLGVPGRDVALLGDRGDIDQLAAAQEHLGQVVRAQLAAEPPDIRRPVGNQVGPAVFLTCAIVAAGVSVVGAVGNGVQRAHRRSRRLR